MNKHKQQLTLRCLGACLLACALAGCADISQYQPAPIKVAASYAGAAAPEQTLTALTPQAAYVSAPWWRAFDDDRLDRLVVRVLANNNDLAAAGLALRKARLEAGLAATALRPTLSGDVSASGSRAVDRHDAVARSYSAGLSLSWQLDLWGKLRAQKNAAGWEARATAQDLQATRLALVGDTCNAYWHLAYLNLSIRTGIDNLTRLQKTLALVKVQRRAGSGTELEVREARQNLESARSKQRALEQQREVVRNQLTVLLGGRAWPETDEPQQLADVNMPEVDAGLPAAILARRPDLRAAELRLRRSLAQLKVTARSYYPTLSLTGSLGSSSQALADLLRNPVATLGAGLTLPFLNFNQARLDTRIAGTGYQLAATHFRTTLYTALSEVRNALSARRSLLAQVASETRSREDAREIARIYGVRYRSGAVPLRTWLDAQSTLRNAELSLADKRRALLDSYVALYLALGGTTSTTRRSPPEATPQ